jgi:hypothetical protein
MQAGSRRRRKGRRNCAAHPILFVVQHQKNTPNKHHPQSSQNRTTTDKRRVKSKPTQYPLPSVAAPPSAGGGWMDGWSRRDAVRCAALRCAACRTFGDHCRLPPGSAFLGRRRPRSADTCLVLCRRLVRESPGVFPFPCTARACMLQAACTNREPGDPGFWIEASNLAGLVKRILAPGWERRTSAGPLRVCHVLTAETSGSPISLVFLQQSCSPVWPQSRGKEESGAGQALC